MSTSDLYLVFGKSVRHWSEHRNGWGSAPLLWDYLGRKYLPGYTGDWQAVWPLNADKRLSTAQRAALLFTLDDAFIPKADFEQAAGWFEEVYADTLADPQTVGQANNWNAFAGEVRRAIDIKDHRLRGMVISCTSVSDPWSMRPAKDFDRLWPITTQEGHAPPVDQSPSG